MTQAASQIFARQPVDEEPEHATVRHEELRRVMATAEFARFPVPWQQPLIDEYNQMRVRSGVYTLEENRQVAEYQLEMQMRLREAPTTILKGPPPPYDAPPQGQPGEVGGQMVGQPSPGPQQGAQGAMPAMPQPMPSMPTSHGVPLMHPAQMAVPHVSRGGQLPPPPGGSARGAPSGMPTPGGSPMMHPGHVPDLGRK